MKRKNRAYKKSRSGRRYKREKRRGWISAAAEAILTLIDLICGCMVCVGGWLWHACMGCLRLMLRATVAAVRILLLVLLWPIRWLLRKLRGRFNRAAQCLRLTGEEFEAYMALVLEDNGFKHVEVTPASGDQGVDILAERNGKQYAIQCKNYSGAVGNFAVQEAYAGAQYYGCAYAVVICPGHYTRSARELAKSTGVILWGEDKLSRMMRISGRRPVHVRQRTCE